MRNGTDVVKEEMDAHTFLFFSFSKHSFSKMNWQQLSRGIKLC